jgi:O-antigen ligase
MLVARNNPYTDALLGWSFILLAASISFSVFLDNVLTLILLVLGVTVYRRKVMDELRFNRIAAVGFPLFVWLLLMSWYGSASLNYSLSIAVKYLDLILAPIFIVASRLPKVRERAESVFLIGSAVVLFFSYALKSGLIPMQSWMWFGAEQGGSVFRHYLVQNLLMAYAVYLAMLRARHAASRISKVLFMAFAILGVVNIFGMVIGRSGQVVMVALLVWYAISSPRFLSLGRRAKLTWGVAIIFTLLVFPFAIGKFFPESAFYSRANLALAEMTNWYSGVAKETSVGARLEFYSRSLRLIEERPVLGYGTGGFRDAYVSLAKNDKKVIGVENPHNQYLLITVQAGVIGLGFLLLLYVTAWRYSNALEGPFYRDASIGVVLIIAIDGLFNSPLLDHTEGLFFMYMLSLWASDRALEKAS